ncbi:serine/threonine-protein kinase [Enhygromyxa salina]|uniref:Serine/threonine-protein kinase PknB n=1 Tax=Enhygromyxa salina TaxID=215803 RepID=A0A2S9XTQ0_9BACT|nr:serine/threonine-protein kinase [Enhygromyxa salina]PRP96232.1 Serine/threonine-protein kinase PknB [Enhygromyxa salina]
MSPCPEPWQLEGLFQATLTREDRSAVERHIDGCERCSVTVAELARLFGSATWGPGSGSGSSLGSGLGSGGSTGARGGPDSAEFGRYRLGPRLGAGGMGMVFEAEDLELHRRVALKILYADPGAELEQTRARLMHEARAMARTAHPNVVAVYEVGRVAEQVFLAMEFVEGATLTRWLASQRRRAEILAAFVQAGRGLEAAHATGLVHRDFKPDNVLVGGDGRVRVTDFGLALAARRVAEPDGAAASADLLASTQLPSERGAIVGTPAYMAPEQWQGEPADARSDQFSFCVALYEALLGVRPFAGDSVAALAKTVLAGRLRAPPRRLPRWLEAVLTRGLAREPAARFVSMAELLAALERDRSAPARALAFVGAMGLVAAAAVGVFAWATGSPSPEPAAAAAPEPSSSSPDRVEPVATEEGCGAAAIADARGRWTAARRDALRTHVAAMDGGQAIIAALLPVLDGWAASWTAQAGRLCDAATESSSREARRGCLDHALDRFDATVTLAGELDGFEVAGALQTAAHRLPELARCEHEGWLRLHRVAPPVELAARATLLGKELAALEAAIDLERWVGTREQAERTVAAAEALAYAPLLAEAQLAQGRLYALLGEPELAVASLEAAAVTGEAAGHERTVGLAALALIDQRGAAQLQLEDGKRWSRTASALADRIGDPSFRGQTLLAEARALAAVAEHREALDKLAEAEPLLRERLAADHPIAIELELARADASLATAEPDAAEAAAKRAEQLALAGLGPEALITARAKAALAEAALARGQLDAAEALARAASKIPGVGRSRRHDLDRGRYLVLLGDIAEARGDHAGALEHHRRAETFLHDGAEAALPLLHQAATQLRAGELEAGRALAEAGWARIDAVWEPEEPRRLAGLRLVGLAALAAGELQLARAALERARTLADEQLGFGPQLARAQADLGYLERAAGNREAALALLDDAYVGLVAGFGLYHPDVVELCLARADLAWELGDHSYAAGLYGAVQRQLVAQRGADDPASARAASRR